MATEDAPASADILTDPTELTHVGPATAAVIEEAPFDAADILHRTISYRALLAAGINPGVAAKLRREYSLVWSFEWLAGANLTCRADMVSGLDPDQREWIAESGSPDVDTTSPDDSDRAWREREAWLEPDAELARPCERCGGRLEAYHLGDARALQCEDCGYVGVPTKG